MINITMNQQPVFIIGSPRSGTSLLRLMMTSHSQIMVPPECGFLVWLANHYGDWAEKDIFNQQRLCNYLNELQECRKFDTWELGSHEIKAKILQIKPVNYSQLSSCVYLAYAEKLGRQSVIWGDKNNFYLEHIPELIKLYPQARFIHIVRDGRDIACSYREIQQRPSSSPYSPNLPIDLVTIARQWSSNLSKILEDLSVLKAEQKLTISYEHLVTEPQVVMQKVVDFLVVDYEPAMLDFYLSNQNQQLEPIALMDWKQRTLEPVSAKTVGRFLTELTVDEIKVFQESARECLQTFEYRLY